LSERAGEPGSSPGAPRSPISRFRLSRDGTLTITVIDAILSEARPAPIQMTLKKDRLKQYFPAPYSPQQMEEVIFSLLEQWRTQHSDLKQEG